MILQVAADARRVQHDVDAVVLQQVRGTDAGELQQLRRIIGSARHQDFAAGAYAAQLAALPVFDGARAAAFKENALRQRVGLDAQIAAVLRRAQIGEGAAGAAAAARRSLEEARALLLRAIEIRIERNAGLAGGLHERFRQRVVMPPVRHRQRAAGAVILVFAALLVLGLPEVRQHVLKAPAGIAALAPAVVILVLAAHIQQAVDRARAAEHFSARLKYLPAVQARFGLGLVHPVDGFFLEQLAVAERHMDPDVRVLGAGFQQQHRILAIGGEAVRQHAAGGAGADDHIIEFGSHGGRVFFLCHAEDDYRMRPKLQASGRLRRPACDAAYRR